MCPSGKVDNRSLEDFALTQSQLLLTSSANFILVFNNSADKCLGTNGAYFSFDRLFVAVATYLHQTD